MIDDTAVKILEFSNDHNVHIEVTYLSTLVIYEMSRKTPSGRTCRTSVQLSSTDLIANNGCNVSYILNRMLERLEEQEQIMEDTNDYT